MGRWGAVNRNRMALVQEGKKLRGLKKKSSEEAMMVMVKLLIVVMFA